MQIGANSYVPVPIPVPPGMMSRGYVPGRPTFTAAALESISLPLILVAVAAGLYMTRTTPAKALSKQSAGTCQSKYCGATNMFVDKPLNTLLKDQSLGVGLGRPRQLPGPTTVYQKIQSDLKREQELSPGVNLVAHTVA